MLAASAPKPTEGLAEELHVIREMLALIVDLNKMVGEYVLRRFVCSRLMCL